MIKEFEDFSDINEVNKILELCKQAKPDQWSLMNEEHLNGPFWNDKRMMTDLDHVSVLTKNISSLLNQDGLNPTAFNKVQRFFKGDILGPLVDNLHVPSIVYGSIFFLQDDDYAGINFPDKNKKIISCHLVSTGVNAISTGVIAISTFC